MDQRMIRLDWDDITLEEARKRVQQILKDLLVLELKLCLSPTSGFHVYVETLYELPTSAVIRLRNEWKDDGTRLVKDILSWGTPYRDVMFNYKVKGGIKWYEEPLEIYTINHSTLQWQIQKLKPESRKSLEELLLR